MRHIHHICNVLEEQQKEPFHSYFPLDTVGPGLRSDLDAAQKKQLDGIGDVVSAREDRITLVSDQEGVIEQLHALKDVRDQEYGRPIKDILGDLFSAFGDLNEIIERLPESFLGQHFFFRVCQRLPHSRRCNCGHHFTATS